jgi:mRNA-degrading endonuclease toxin of MazEF toxin-antitoxin module
MKRGDVILVRFPHPSGLRGKKRPAIIIQSDSYRESIATVVLAEVTTNLTMAGDPACLYIDIKTPDGKATGLSANSVVSCLRLVTAYADNIRAVLGVLSPAMTQKLDECLAVALAIKRN